MNFQVVSHNSLREFEEKVLDLLEKGWLPVGGVGFREAAGVWFLGMEKSSS
jgi:hypothetical protein